MLGSFFLWLIVILRFVNVFFLKKFFLVLVLFKYIIWESGVNWGLNLVMILCINWLWLLGFKWILVLLLMVRGIICILCFMVYCLINVFCCISYLFNVLF